MSMSIISRKVGTMILMGVPAIIGGGIIYAIFKDLTAIFIYETILLLGVGTYLAR